MTGIKPKQGGKRAGAGRKPKEGDIMVRVTYRLHQEQKNIVAANGGAALVRKLIDNWVKEKGS